MVLRAESRIRSEYQTSGDSSARVSQAQCQGRKAGAVEGENLIPEIKLQYVAPEDKKTLYGRIVTMCKAVVGFWACGTTSWVGFYGLKLFNSVMEGKGLDPYKSSSLFIAGSILCCVPAVYVAVRLTMIANSFLERKFGVSADVQNENDIQLDRYERARYNQRTNMLLAKLEAEQNDPDNLEATYKTVTVKTARNSKGR